MKIALVYDRVNKVGGAERVLQALHQIWPHAPLYTSVFDPIHASWAKDWEVRPSGLNHLRFLRSRHEYLPWIMPYVFESLDFSDFDVVISITSAEAKGIITRPDQLHLCYLLTPTRYLWSHTHLYTAGNLGVFKQYVFSNLRRWDLIAASRPDYYLTISRLVAARLKKFYRRDPYSVIYPPIDHKKFSGTQVTKKGKYYLLVARLVNYKRVELAIEACNRLRVPLRVVGSGKEEARLKRIAGNTIHFEGLIPDVKLASMYQETKALIVPQEEDFGLVSLESQAAGTPVISFNKGGATETMINGVTGVLFYDQTVDSLCQAIKKSDQITWNPVTIKKNAAKFDIKKFELIFKDTVNTLWQKHTQ